MTTSPWDEVWQRRTLDRESGSLLSALMAADGLGEGPGRVDEEDWSAYVRTTAECLGIAAGSSVLEVGCGSGAFLYELYRQGCTVSGIDRSPTLIEYARQAMPEGRFEVADASQLDPGEPVDAVVSFGVFLYFPSQAYARGVLERMAASARHVVAVLDVPDRSRRAEDLARRQELAGGAEAYEQLYRGLAHLYFDRAWFARELARCGLTDVEVADQELAGYSHAPFRFNAWGFVPADREAPHAIRRG